MDQNFLVRSQKIKIYFNRINIYIIKILINIIYVYIYLYNYYIIVIIYIIINKDGFQMKSSRACHPSIRQEMTDGFREKKRSVQGKRRQPWPAL